MVYSTLQQKLKRIRKNEDFIFGTRLKKRGKILTVDRITYGNILGKNKKSPVESKPTACNIVLVVKRILQGNPGFLLGAIIDCLHPPSLNSGIQCYKT